MGQRRGGREILTWEEHLKKWHKSWIVQAMVERQCKLYGGIETRAQQSSFLHFIQKCPELNHIFSVTFRHDLRKDLPAFCHFPGHHAHELWMLDHIIKKSAYCCFQ